MFSGIHIMFAIICLMSLSNYFPTLYPLKELGWLKYCSITLSSKCSLVLSSWIIYMVSPSWASPLPKFDYMLYHKENRIYIACKFGWSKRRIFRNDDNDLLLACDMRGRLMMFITNLWFLMKVCTLWFIWVFLAGDVWCHWC